MTPQEFQVKTGVDTTTLARLIAYADLLVKWQARINLVGPDTLPDVWKRHFLDSAQIFPLLRRPFSRLVDLGSGAGFPGLVLAILGVPDVHLVESDARKAVFLREAARITATPITVHAQRIEKLPPLAAGIITSRALAPLEKLLDLAHPHLAPNGDFFFLKGKGADDELTRAGKEWIISIDRIPSQTDPSGAILHLREVRRGRA